MLFSDELKSLTLQYSYLTPPFSSHNPLLLLSSSAVCVAGLEKTSRSRSSRLPGRCPSGRWARRRRSTRTSWRACTPWAASGTRTSWPKTCCLRSEWDHRPPWGSGSAPPAAQLRLLSSVTTRRRWSTSCCWTGRRDTRARRTRTCRRATRSVRPCCSLSRLLGFRQPENKEIFNFLFQLLVAIVGNIKILF